MGRRNCRGGKKRTKTENFRLGQGAEKRKRAADAANGKKNRGGFVKVEGKTEEKKRQRANLAFGGGELRGQTRESKSREDLEK